MQKPSQSEHRHEVDANRVGRKRNILNSMAVLAGPIGVLLGCAPHTKNYVADSLDSIRQQVTAGDALMVDVREIPEWSDGVLEGARLVSYTELKKDPRSVAEQAGLPHDVPLYLYCKAGGRAAKAAEMLTELGYDARPLKQGYTTLVREGFWSTTSN